jgi:hypothetical protein
VYDSTEKQRGVRFKTLSLSEYGSCYLYDLPHAKYGLRRHVFLKASASLIASVAWIINSGAHVISVRNTVPIAVRETKHLEIVSLAVFWQETEGATAGSIIAHWRHPDLILSTRIRGR